MQRMGKTLVGALVLLTLLLVICACLVISATTSSNANRALALHGIQVVQAAEKLLTEVQDAETGQRGYILTHQEQYLAPYRAAILDIPPTFDVLRSLLTATADEVAQADRLQAAIHTKLYELEKTVEVAQKQGFDDALKIVQTDVGKKAMDEIRQTVQALVEEETALTAAKRANVYYWDRVNLIVAAVAGPVLLAALIFAAFMVHGSVGRLQQAERATRQQAGLLQATLDNVRDGVAAFDAAGVLIASNRRFFKLLSFPPEFARSGHPLSAFVTFEANRAQRIFSDTPTSGHEAPVDGGIIRRITVENREMEVYRNAMPQGGFIITAMDITQRLRAEEALRQSQKLESIGQLTGGVAHDFNNLLQVIIGNIEALARAVKDDPDMLLRAKTALLGAQRGARLTRHLLAFARRQPLNPIPTNLGRLIQGMSDLLQRTLSEQIQIESVIAGGLWNTLVDPIQVESAILNLAINSRDAMREGGKLTIEVGNAFLDEAYAAEHAEVTAGQYVMLAVTDTGTGMAPAVAARAFEPFFTTKQEGEGTGLGLSMVWGLVKQSGGHIKIYTELGLGTTIKLYLPRERRAEQSLGTQDSSVVGGDERVLVVEDDISVRQTAVDMLRQLGYQVATSESGEQAVVLLKTGTPFDLLFTDVVMPGSIGSRELARQAQALLPGLRVLFTSGYTENAVIHHGRLDPGVHLLSKPYGIEELARKVRVVLASKPDGESSPILPTARPLTGRILLVEDDALVAMSTVDMLGQLGLAVKEASSGSEAMDIVKSDPDLDAVIADVGLPDMDGHSLVREIRKLRPRIKVIMATGFLAGSAAAKPEDEAGVVHLGKPYQLADLQYALERLML
jgi:signal transduction histidine kinase/DNA-binding response OmpR family regulator